MKLDSGTFTAAQVIRITGVSYENLNYWAKIGLLKPSVVDARGSGSRRLYDFKDLIAIRLALKLRRAGIFGKTLAKVLERLRQAGFDFSKEVGIKITDNGDAVICSNHVSISAHRQPGQLFLQFDCSRELAEVRQLVRSEETQAEGVKSTKPHTAPKSIKKQSASARKDQRTKSG